LKKKDYEKCPYCASILNYKNIHLINIDAKINKIKETLNLLNKTQLQLKHELNKLTRKRRINNKPKIIFNKRINKNIWR
tara:strand:- start:1185 stop:1421 length:237 start_codon:yes stop_codon:yes gene_type:complete